MEILTLTGDMVFKTEMIPGREEKTGDFYSDKNYYLLRGVMLDLEGTSLSNDQNVPFTASLNFDYSARPSGDIKIDKEGYVGYDYGKYEFVGELWLPSMQDLRLDALIRTDVNPDDNSKNRVFAEFRDRSNEGLMIGLYYINEKTYIDTTGLENVYGGVKLDDIGLPQAYMEGFNLASFLNSAFNFFDNFLISFVDDFVSPQDDSKSDRLMQAIMAKMESTKVVPGDPLSRNTVNIRLDVELVKEVLYEEQGIMYTTADLVSILNIYAGIDMDEIATILGVTNAEILMDNSWFYLTFDVDTNEITIKLFSDFNNVGHADLMMELVLQPTKIGEEVKMVFPSRLDEYTELGQIKTYSAEINGKFTFTNDEEVDLSGLLGSFMGDPHGANTPYILPDKAVLEINLVFDQYIREQVLEGGRLTEKNRNAFILRAFITDNQGNETDVFRVYANDVSFKSDATIENLGYIWVDLVCLPNIPKFKIREDIVLDAFAEYMGDSDVVREGTSLGVTTIIAALLEDSWPVFEPEVINITTGNETLRKIFGVNSLIGDINAKIGLVQRVKGIDALERDFAIYKVGSFTNIQGSNPYAIELHETIDVTFDYGSYKIVLPMKVTYDEDSIAIVENRVIYNVKLKDTFMGVTRGYNVSITGGVGSRNAITDISPVNNNGFIWEPLLPMPTSVVAQWAGGLYTYYNVDFDINWDEITIEGGVYNTTVTVGKGMMATFTKDITITVLNRIVDTDESRRVVADPYSTERTMASVVNQVTIDPYHYILAKYNYFAIPANQNKTDDDFIIHYFREFNITIDFMGDTPSHTGRFDWYFDRFQVDPNNPNHYDTRLYVESDINPSGSVTRYWSFNGLALVLESKDDGKDYQALTLNGKYKYFNGEQTTYWTFDGTTLVPEIENTDVIYTELTENQRYTFTTDGAYTYLHSTFRGQVIVLKVKVLSRTFKELWFEGESEPNTYTIDALLTDSYTIPVRPRVIFKEINPITNQNYFLDLPFDLVWSNPVATNIDINGTLHPFGLDRNNITSSFISVYRDLRVGEWFATPLATVQVLCPAKVILPTSVIVDNAEGPRVITEFVGVTPQYGDIVPSKMDIAGYSDGIYHVDPYNPSTWIIPTFVDIYFENGTGGGYYSQTYKVQWDTSKGIVQLQNNNYLFTHLGNEEAYYLLEADIGNPLIGYQKISLAIRNMSTTITDISFIGEEYAELSGDYITGFEINIDPYLDFEMPTSMLITFECGDVREYQTNWTGYQSFVPGTSFTIQTKIGDINNNYFSGQQIINLTVNVEQRTITDLVITNSPDANITVIYDGVSLSNGVSSDVIIVIDLDNKQINISGIVLDNQGVIENLLFDGALLYGNIYEAIAYILDEFILSFEEISEQYTINPNLNTYPVVFDTQKAILPAGQNFIIYLARFAGSVDYTVNVKASGGVPIRADSLSGVVRITPYLQDGTFLFEGGLVLEDQEITILLMDNTPVVYNITEWLIVSCPNPNYSVNDSISVISADDVRNGGVWQLSARLPDGSNIRRNFDIIQLEIGTYFSTPSDYTGNFIIRDGMITIDNIYGFYPLHTTLIPANLPTRLDILDPALGIRVENLVWTLLPGLSGFNGIFSQVDYTGLAPIEIAYTRVLGRDIYLSLEVLPAVIERISVIDPQSGTIIKSSENSIQLYFDAYQNHVFGGIFEFARLHYVAHFAGTGASHTFRNLTFLCNDMTTTFIPYNIEGHRRAVTGPGTDVPDNKRVTIHASNFPGSQQLSIPIYFYNKTVVGVGIEPSTLTDQKIVDIYEIDPYGNNIQVPNHVYIKFEQGDDLELTNANWIMPSGFRVDYRGGSFMGDNSLTRMLTGFNGIITQRVDWNVTVYNRELDYYTLNGISNIDGPTFHITDPFAGRVSDIPSHVITAASPIGLVEFTDLQIQWNLLDRDINYLGTVGLSGGFVNVVGYIKNQQVGQRVEIKLYINRWEFQSIHDQYSLMNPDKYILMNPANFTFSRIDDKSIVGSYNIRFRITDPTKDPVSQPYDYVYYDEVKFVTQCHATSEDMHIIFWNNFGKDRARSTGDLEKTNFEIGTKTSAGKTNIVVTSVDVYYQYQTPSITGLDFGYGMGGKNQAILVVNLLETINPNFRFPNNAIVQGTLDQINYILLSDIFEVQITWPSVWEANAEARYLGGGIRYGYQATVTLRVRNDNGVVIYVYSEVFRVNLVFLDLTPIKELTMNKADPVPTSLTATVLRDYSPTTYEGRVNPYGEQAYAAYNLHEALKLGYSNLDVDQMNMFYYNLNFGTIPDPITQDIILQSVSFTFNGMTFNSRHIKLKIINE